MNEIVSVAWLNENSDNEKLIVLDASLKSTIGGLRTDLDQKTIPQARYFDIANDFVDKESPFPNTIPDTAQFELAVRRLGINKDSIVVVFDNLGIYSSPRVWWLFKIMGHIQIFVLDGGLPEWKNKGFLMKERMHDTYEIGDFNADFQNQYLVTYSDVLLNRSNQSFVLVDARSKGRFNGTEKEPRKQLKSGCVGNSVNRPYQEVLDNGKYKSKEELRQLFESIGDSDTDFVFSCGSGLTACILMLACEISYKKSRRLYDGSWSEWAELQGLKETKV